MDDFYKDPSINGLSTLFGKQQTQSQASTAPATGDPLRTPDWLLADIDKVMDPDDRTAFKDGRPGLRKFPADAESITLSPGNATEDDYMQHRSHRDFAADAIDAWIDSPGHCSIIMNPTLEEVGAGVAQGNFQDRTASYWTLVFASEN